MKNVMDQNKPQLDEKVWSAWIEKGQREEKVSAARYRIVGMLAAVVVVGLYFLSGTN